MTNQKKGFTLIELLVVIAIIGILSAIGLVSLNGAREKARDAQRKSDLGQMNTALILYYDDHTSKYPTQSTAALEMDTNADCVISSAAGTPDWPVVTAVYAAVNTGTATGNVWDSTGPMVTEYLSRELIPPGGGTGWQTVYCYDSNDAASTPYTSYVLFAGLEAGAGDTFFALNDEGTSDDDNDMPVACSDPTVAGLEVACQVD